MIAGKFCTPHKPIATKGISRLGPVCFVDATRAASGPRLREAEKIDIELVKPVKKEPTNEERALTAAEQWSRPEFDETEAKPWLKSWYYPLDAFDPWPQKTDLCCWWCTCPFDWAPFPLPYSYDVASCRYRTIGMFCGPSCAKAYARGDGHYSSMPNIDFYIEKIATTMYGYTGGSSRRCVIPVAPPKEILQKYCGPCGFTIEQYRAACRCGRSLHVLPPNFITMKQVMIAQQEMAKTKVVYHAENPDELQTLSTLVKQKRIPYAGAGAMRIADFFKTRS